MELDWNKITEATAYTKSLKSWDVEDAVRVVEKVAKKYLAKDLATYNITGIEQPAMYFVGLKTTVWEKSSIDRAVEEVREGRLDGSAIVRMVFDWMGRRYDDGSVVVNDWKTSRNLDARWAQRLKDSRQWKMYCMASGAKTFVYRGLHRQDEPREIVCHLTDEIADSVRHELQQLTEMRRLLRTFSAPWPRNFGHCGAYGKECPFWGPCRTGNVAPGTAIHTDVLSHTSIQLQLDCPEKLRNYLARNTAAEPDETDSDLLFGSAVHAGIAEMYTQALAVE